STMMTWAPFFSVRSWNAGNSTGRSGPGAGGCSFFWAAAGAAPRPNANATNAAPQTIVLILVIITSSLGARRGARTRRIRPGGRTLRRHDRQDGPVRLGEILAGGGADVLRGDRHVPVQVSVDLGRVAVV